MFRTLRIHASLPPSSCPWLMWLSGVTGVGPRAASSLPSFPSPSLLGGPRPALEAPVGPTQHVASARSIRAAPLCKLRLGAFCPCHLAHRGWPFQARSAAARAFASALSASATSCYGVGHCLQISPAHPRAIHSCVSSRAASRPRRSSATTADFRGLWFHFSMGSRHTCSAVAQQHAPMGIPNPRAGASRRGLCAHLAILGRAWAEGSRLRAPRSVTTRSFRTHARQCYPPAPDLLLPAVIVTILGLI